MPSVINHPCKGIKVTLNILINVDGVHRLKVGDVFKDVGHFSEALHEMLARKWFNINIK